MNSSKQDTAILLFSRTPKEEANYKRLTYNLRKNRKITDHLINHSYQVAFKTGLPVYVVFSDQQYGKTFGERFANAFKLVFAKGFKNVISIGNDCVTLTKDDIQKSAEVLKYKKLVLGPAKDGGVYLLGMQKSVFREKEFIGISWLTEKVFDELKNLTTDECCYSLKVKQDIDLEEDLYSHTETKVIERILKLIRSKRAIPFLNSDYNYSPLFFFRNVLLRAPPMAT